MLLCLTAMCWSVFVCPALVLSYNPEVLALADEIGKTPDVSAAHTAQACRPDGRHAATSINHANEQRSICAPCSLVVQAELLAKALAVTAAAAEAAAASKGAGAGAGASAGGAGARKGRPALNIGAVKNANATPEAAQADEQESQADALLKAKRMRNLKRQSLPEKLPASVQDQMPQ